MFCEVGSQQCFARKSLFNFKVVCMTALLIDFITRENGKFPLQDNNDKIVTGAFLSEWKSCFSTQMVGLIYVYIREFIKEGSDWSESVQQSDYCHTLWICTHIQSPPVKLCDSTAEHCAQLPLISDRWSDEQVKAPQRRVSTVKFAINKVKVAIKIIICQWWFSNDISLQQPINRSDR